MPWLDLLIPGQDPSDAGKTRRTFIVFCTAPVPPKVSILMDCNILSIERRDAHTYAVQIINLFLREAPVITQTQTNSTAGLALLTAPDLYAPVSPP